MKGKFVVIIGPSASGKTELVKALLARIPNSTRLKTKTTRGRRPGEKDEYFFITLEEFMKGINEGDFFEYTEVYGNLYGSSKKELDSCLASFDFVFAIIDVKGARTLREKIPDALMIFVNPGPIENLRKRVLAVRGDIPENELQNRLVTAAYEMSFTNSFDAVVHNNEGCFEQAVMEAMSILEK